LDEQIKSKSDKLLLYHVWQSNGIFTSCQVLHTRTVNAVAFSEVT